VNRDALIAQLIQHEGQRSKAYQDSRGIWTIGVGHNLEANPISDMAIHQVLSDDITEIEGRLDLNLPWWRSLSEVRQRVLADMCFNLGIGKLLGFNNTLAAIANGRYSDAAALMLQSTWAAQVGKRAKRLSRMMESDKEVSLLEV